MIKTLMYGAPLVLMIACDDGADRRDGTERWDDGYALTEPDARKALDEVAMISGPDAASAEVIDVTAEITVGERIDAIADRWRSFWESQAPCNHVTFEGNVVTVDFGTLDDACTYGGDTFAGTDTITLTQIMDADSDLRLDHVWSGFTNGVVGMDGTTGVFWSGAGSRQVEIDHTLTNAAGDVVDVWGQHTMRRLDPNLPVGQGGLEVNGDRSWDAGNGVWNVELNALAMFVDEGSPHDGDVVMTGPNGNQLTIEYSRVDADTTRAVVTGPGGRVFVFRITADGATAE